MDHSGWLIAEGLRQGFDFIAVAVARAAHRVETAADFKAALAEQDREFVPPTPAETGEK